MTQLGGAIKEKLGIACVHNNGIMELMRGIRSQLTGLIEGLSEKQLKSMMLGLGHSLSRYKLKFSPDKVDTMIVQAVGLLDELDKVRVLLPTNKHHRSLTPFLPLLPPPSSLLPPSSSLLLLRRSTHMACVSRSGTAGTFPRW